MMQKISIITVCYNSEDTIEDTLNSVMGLEGINEFYELEYIIVDGKSDDNTLGIINENKSRIASKGISISVLSEKDTGIYDAWNKGLKLASGQLIGILSSDDWYPKNVLINLTGEIKDFSKSFIVTGLREQYTYEKEYMYTRAFKKKIHHNIKWRMPISFTATFISREAYNAVGQYNTNYRLSADYEFIYRAIKKKIPFHFLNKNLVCMRHGGATNNNKNLFTSAYEDYLIRNAMGENVLLSRFIHLKRKAEIQVILLRNKWFR